MNFSENMESSATSDSQSQVFQVGEFRIDAGKRLFLRAGVPVSLTPKVFDTLVLLVKSEGKLLRKEELMQAIWPDTTVEENNLNQNISTLRRALGEGRGENRYIATIPGKGYRFIADVEIVFDGHSHTPQPLTIGVLPFESLGAGPEREYFADGLTEETIAALGRIEPDHFGVIGRTSVMQYKRTTKSLAEIGRELHAAYLIESSIREEGSRFRITSKLVRVRDQLQVWSASYDSEPRSMLVFQSELGAVIAEQIRLRLSPKRLQALAKRQTQNAEAYDLYLHGRHFWNQLTAPTTRRAIEYFTHATQLDPKYALAWSGLADAYSASPVNGDAQPLMVWPKAREAMAKAIESEPGLAEVQTSLGFLKFWLDWDWPGAETAVRKAIEQDHSYPLAYRALGVVLSHMRRHDEAQLAMRRARELDPLYVMHQSLSSQVAFAARDYSAAVQFARQAIVVDPEFWIAHLHLAQIYVELGEFSLALEELDSAGKLSGGNTKTIALRGYIFAKTQRPAEAREVLQTLGSISRERYVPPYAMALVHAGLEQRDSALDWLERGRRDRDVHLTFLPVDPKWDAYRRDERFQALIKICGFKLAS
ncbi:MAG: winged helix-turn-helix domain-containing protein [Terriglobales bacterium]